MYDNAFAVNASLEKARSFLLASEYEHDSYPAKKTKIKIIQEEIEEANNTSDKPVVESAWMIETLMLCIAILYEFNRYRDSDFSSSFFSGSSPSSNFEFSSDG